MQTYFIVTTLPLEVDHRATLETCHRNATGNGLAVIPNADKTACVVKVKTDLLPENFLPSGLVAEDVLTDIVEARALLTNTAWVSTNV